MQGCLKSAIVALRAGNSAERGPLYVSFFNYSAGLERLLKLTLILDHCVRHKGAMPSFATVRNFGHDVLELYRAAEKLFPLYQVQTPSSCQPDTIDGKMLEFLAGFATFGRYFNLDALTGSGKSQDPLPEWNEILKVIYQSDVPELKRISSEEQVDASFRESQETTVYVPGTSLDGVPLSLEELYQDHGKILLVLPEVIWRLVKLLVPLKELLLALRERLHQGKERNPEDIPFMEDFLEFVCSDRAAVFADSDWPYFG
jgi:hypothetical protein